MAERMESGFPPSLSSEVDYQRSFGTGIFSAQG